MSVSVKADMSMFMETLKDLANMCHVQMTVFAKRGNEVCMHSNTSSDVLGPAVCAKIEELIDQAKEEDDIDDVQKDVISLLLSLIINLGRHNRGIQCTVIGGMLDIIQPADDDD